MANSKLYFSLSKTLIGLYYWKLYLNTKSKFSHYCLPLGMLEKEFSSDTVHGSKKTKIKRSVIYEIHARVEPNSYSGEEKFKLCK